MNLDNFYFPVAEREIALTDNGQPVSGYKAIVSPNDGRDEPISVVKNSYKLVPNRQIIEPFLEQVNSLDTRWYIDPSHTFACISRMRLQVTFPELCIHDGESLIPLSLYLHNSYDMSEGVRVFFGAIRLACSNGMVLGRILGSFYGRHTSGFAFDRLAVELDHAAAKIDSVKERITYLQHTTPNEAVENHLLKALGKRRVYEVLGEHPIRDLSQWDVFNRLTHHISHQVDKERRSDLQIRLSGVFEL